jgi:hypothetical protein
MALAAIELPSTRIERFHGEKLSHPNAIRRNHRCFHMQWLPWFGQVVAGLIGLVSALWIIGGGILLALRVLSREDYTFEGDKFDYRR